MKRFIVTNILLIGFAFSLYCHSQDSIKSKKLERPNFIFFAPLNLFDFVNPNFQIGYERFIAQRWSLQIEAGIIINHSIENYVIDWLRGIKVRDCLYTNKGFRVKLSVKYILLDKRRIKLYISPELFYLRNKSGITRSFLVSNPDFEYSESVPKGMNAYTQFFYNDEEKMGVNFKAGIKLLFGKHFFMEPHWGIGFAYRNIAQTGKENPDDKLWDGFGIFDNATSNKWVPTIPFNLKIGVWF